MVATVKKAKTYKVKKTPKKEPELIQKFYRVDPKTKQKYKAGIFYAVCPDRSSAFAKILIGFSFCNKHAGDRYDYVDGKHIKGHGLISAKKRAYRWQNISCVHVGGKNGFPGIVVDIEEFVLIPTFAVTALVNFIIRCEKYFKKPANFWAGKFIDHFKIKALIKDI
jgi:hypothetical protein